MRTLRNPVLPTLAVLTIIMVATRYHHFGDALHVPDASLAVFFLAGLLVSPAVALVILLLEAGAIDYLAITVGGVSDYCVSPAYGFLIPTYAVLWIAGRWTAARHMDTGRDLLHLYAALGIAVTVAFAISDASFFVFSGRFPQMGFGEYAARVARYYPPYALSALGYVSLAVVLHLALARLRRIAGHDAPATTG